MPTKPKKLTYNPLDTIVVDGEGAVGLEIRDLDPTQILPHPNQPRRFHDSEKEIEMEASVRESGIHQPLLVRQLITGDYQLVAGSRRLAAALVVGLSTVPAVVRDYSDDQAEQVALIENLQRSDLRFDDEAVALQRLKGDSGLTNEALGRLIGKSTDYVELRIAAAEHPSVLAMYMAGEIEQKQIRATIRGLKEVAEVDNPDSAAVVQDDPNGSDQEPSGDNSTVAEGGRNRRGRRPPDGWRWAGDTERRLQQLPERAARMDPTERSRAREYLLRLREAADRALDRLQD